jgi:predicted pyridoxine 5'-phosphate oxidase superfamily flavin-nucleotide-binding protein
MVDVPSDLFELLTSRDPGILKAIVTVNAEGIPNIAPMGSITALDFDVIAFGDVSLLHTRENLEGNNQRVVIFVYKAPTTAYQIKGTFLNFQDSGAIYEQFVDVLAEMGAKASLRAVGLVKVDAVYSSKPGDYSKKLA